MNQAIGKNLGWGGRTALSLIVTILAISQAVAQDAPRGQGQAAGQEQGQRQGQGPRRGRGNQTPSELAKKLMEGLPLTPLTKDRDGDFHIAPPYKDDPAFTEKEGVPKGKVVRFTMNSADSKIFSSAPPRGQRGGEQSAIQQTVFERPVAVYIPAGYVAGTPTPFIVVMDGV